jgi:membrane-bound ClpP family serine protease
MAKSAATMIAFGASTIHMSDTAELGPVDPQVTYVDDHGKTQWISAEEYVRSYEDLITRATDGKAKKIEPFIQQLTRYDSRYIEKLKSAQRLSEDISVRLLQTGMMQGKDEKEIKRCIEEFLSQQKTSSHGRMINPSGAKDCGLAIKNIALQSKIWKHIWQLYLSSDWVVTNRCLKIIESSSTALNLGQ